jgi:hypothetical protein
VGRETAEEREGLKGSCPGCARRGGREERIDESGEAIEETVECLNLDV